MPYDRREARKLAKIYLATLADAALSYGSHRWEPHHFTMRGHTVQGFRCLRCGRGVYASWLERSHLASSGCRLGEHMKDTRPVLPAAIPEDPSHWLILTVQEQ